MLLLRGEVDLVEPLDAAVFALDPADGAVVSVEPVGHAPAGVMPEGVERVIGHGSRRPGDHRWALPLSPLRTSAKCAGSMNGGQSGIRTWPGEGCNQGLTDIWIVRHGRCSGGLGVSVRFEAESRFIYEDRDVRAGNEYGFREIRQAATRLTSLAEVNLTPAGAVTPSPADWADQVLYFLLPDRFSDGREDARPMFDRANPDASRHESVQEWMRAGCCYEGGRLKGIEGKLDYLRGLGVTTLWIGPVWKQRADLETYHGYGVQNFLEVDPRWDE